MQGPTTYHVGHGISSIDQVVLDFGQEHVLEQERQPCVTDMLRCCYSVELYIFLVSKNKILIALV